MVLVDTDQLVIATMVIFVSSVVLSTVGFGFGVTSTPLLLLVLDPQTVVLLINSTSVILCAFVFFQNKDYLPGRKVVPVSIAGALGVPIGVVALKFADPTLLRIVISILIIVLVLGTINNRPTLIPQSRFIALIVGFIGGVLITALGVGGPLLALVFLSHGFSKNELRGSLSFYFIMIGLPAIVGYAVSGMYTPERLSLIIMCIVPVMVGFTVGSVLVRKMNEVLFRRAVFTVILTTSMILLGQGTFSLL